MALTDLSSTYPGKAEAPSAEYPQGRIRDDSTGTAGDGTPVAEGWLDDWQGFFAALLLKGLVAPSNVVDTALASDFYDGMKRIVRDTLDEATIGWLIETTVDRQQSYDPSAETTSGTGAVAFSVDGTKMYFQGQGLGLVFQYTLSTPWDITTATYDTVSFNHAAQSVSMDRMVFKPDGTKMFLMSQTIYQYTLSTAWDISTASYDTVSFNPSTQDTSMVALAFKPDGTAAFLIGTTTPTDSAFQYSLGTAWDLSTMVYDTISLDLQTAMGSNSFWEIDFNSNGLYFFAANNNSVTTPEIGPHQWVMTTAWDISTATYTGVNYDVAPVATTVGDMKFSPTGGRMYVLGNGILYAFNTGSLSGGF